MNRSIGALVVAGLLFALAPRPAFASDIADQLFLRVFGENSDAAAAFAPGINESPLRDYALQVTLVQPSAPQPLALPATKAGEAFLLVPPAATAAMMPGSVTVPEISSAAPAASAPISVDYYQAPQPAPTVPSALALGAKADSSLAGGSGLVTFSPAAGPSSGLDGTGAPVQSFGANAVTALPAMAVPLRVGPVRVTGRASAATAQDPSLALRDDAYAAGANFSVQAGKRNVDLDVSSDVEHMTRNDETPLAATNFGGNSTVQIPSDGQAPVLVPGYADVTKHTMGAAVAVPVNSRVQFNMQYNNQRLYGDYGAPGLANLDAQAATYGAGVTLAIPHTAGALSISARQYHYQDNVFPSNTFTQTAGNVKFTVKF